MRPLMGGAGSGGGPPRPPAPGPPGAGPPTRTVTPTIRNGAAASKSIPIVIGMAFLLLFIPRSTWVALEVSSLAIVIGPKSL